MWRRFRLEDTRITYLKQVILLVIVLGVLAYGSTSVHADSTGTGSISVVPGNGGARGIQLRSQTVDLVIKEDATGAWADTDLRVQLYNRGATEVVMPIGIPGPQVSNTEMPEIAEAALGGRPLALIRVANPNGPEIQATATVTVPVRGSVDIRIRYRQALTIQDGLVSYAYLLVAGHVWAGAPESLRVSVTFARPLPPEQVLHLAPTPHSPRPGTFTWEWGGVKAPSNVGLAFMSSPWWQELQGDRAAAAAPEAGLNEHVALGERYWHVATLAPPVFAPRASFYERFASPAIAEWRAGIMSAKVDTSPAELAAARERLAGLYLSEGSREGGSAGQAYLQLAVSELTEAVTLNPEDAELRASAKSLQQRLAEAAGGRGGEANAGTHSAALRELNAVRVAQDADACARAEVLLLAYRAVEGGDFPNVRRILTGAFGADVLVLPDARPPHISQSLLDVSNAPGQRTLSLQLIDNTQGSAASEVVSEAVTALRGFSDVIASGTVLTVTLTYSDPAVLLTWQDRLDAVLPDLPELALISSVLSTRHLAWPMNEDILTRTDGYQESVDLSKSLIAWETEAAKLEQAANEAELKRTTIGTAACRDLAQ